MNKLVKVGLVAGGAISLYFLISNNGLVNIKTSDLRKAAESEVPDIYTDKCVDALAKYEDAKTAADGVRKADKLVRDQEKIAVGYTTAKSNEEMAKKALDEAKKVLKDYKPDSTQVAVGSGDSAIAINVQNSGQKAILEANLQEAQSKYNMMKARRELLDDTINQKVITSRTPEQLEIMSNESRTYHEYQDTLKEYNKAIDDIMSNEEWKYEKLHEFFKKNVSESDIIINAVGLSAFPVALLVYIWADAKVKLGLLNK